MRPPRPRLVTFGLGLLLAAAGASAEMPATVDSPGAALQLAAEPWLRDAGSSKVEVGLYAGAKLPQRAAFVSAAGSKRLRVVLKDRLSADQIGRLLMRDVDTASPRAEVSPQLGHLLKMGDAFAACRQLTAGRSFGFEFVPGQGTRLLIDDAAASTFIGDAGFFAVLVRPWLAATTTTAAAAR